MPLSAIPLPLTVIENKRLIFLSGGVKPRFDGYRGNALLQVGNLFAHRHRYLDGWREKETRAAMIFGRCSEKALESYFCGDDCGAALFREWGAFRDTPFAFKKGETWDRLVH